MCAAGEGGGGVRGVGEERWRGEEGCRVEMVIGLDWVWDVPRERGVVG